MKPLSERVRPQKLDDFFGQDHLVGSKGILRQNLEGGYLPSFILWGPPGVGKTTLAGIIAQQLNRKFYVLSAIDSGVKQLREVIDQAAKQAIYDHPSPLLFIDEIHRFSKNQQDALLKAVEQGTITLIGATTENPSFEVISPLLSRMQVYRMHELSSADITSIIDRAISTDPFLSKLEMGSIDYATLFQYGGGDARKTLNLLEQVIHSYSAGEEILIHQDRIAEVARTNPLNYDKQGDQHYDIVSAFIKSIRGSDPDAALYWMARMIAGGEDPLFICRRMIISAAEDIGLANPNALLLANSCYQVVERIGMPEGRIPMAETAIFLATAEKSNAAYLAIDRALQKVKETGAIPVPLHLRNAPTQLMKENNFGKDYLYPHNYDKHFVQQAYLPKLLEDEIFFQVQNNSFELKLKKRLSEWWPKKSKKW